MDSYISRWENDPMFIDLNGRYNKIHGIDNKLNTAFIGRLYILRQLAKQQLSKNSNFAECGTYAGMSVHFVADICSQRFIGIDSFEGVSEPGPNDTEYFKTLKLAIPQEIAEKTMQSHKNVELYKGWIPEIFSTIDSLEYSYVHIDVDLYEPTKNSIEYFWPKLINGGVLICDDFGSYKTIGARKAMLDFFKQDNILELPTGQAIVYKNE
ncbi:MAG: class I SAM-dependent methyltransferase [Sediminibacterium sp.]